MGDDLSNLRPDPPVWRQNLAQIDSRRTHFVCACCTAKDDAFGTMVFMDELGWKIAHMKYCTTMCTQPLSPCYYLL